VDEPICQKGPGSSRAFSFGVSAEYRPLALLAGKLPDLIRSIVFGTSAMLITFFGVIEK
jgi:hypothetical protein